MNLNTVKQYLLWGLGLLFVVLPFSTAFLVGAHELELPTEPLLGCLAVLGGYYFIRAKDYHSYIKHPLVLLFALYWGWNAVAIVFAQHTQVALKYTLVGFTHWWVFFALAVVVLDKYKNWAQGYILLYAAAFLLILFYAWTQHALYDFRKDASVLVARPFYFDHAMYACTALLLVGALIGVLYKLEKKYRLYILLTLVCLLLGVYTSFSRAAWLSLIAALGSSLFVVLFKPQSIYILLVLGLLGIGVGLGVWSYTQQQNQVLAQKNMGYWQHLKSVANLRTDVSNLERLNRYSCAWRMFKDRPLLGFGPGNYIMTYYPYQKADEMTRLSVKEHKRHRAGKGGGAHSDYLQMLSEVGWPALLLWLLIILWSLKTAVGLFYNAHTKTDRYMALGVFFALLTYYAHTLFNNFFQHGKVIALLWLMFAWLFVTDQKNKSKN